MRSIASTFRSILTIVLILGATLATIPHRAALAADAFEPIPASLPVITAQNAGRLNGVASLDIADFRYTNHRTTFSPDGRFLAFGLIDSGLMTITLLELSTGKRMQFSPVKLGVSSQSLHQQVVFSHDGRLI